MNLRENTQKQELCTNVFGDESRREDLGENFYRQVPLVDDCVELSYDEVKALVKVRDQFSDPLNSLKDISMEDLERLSSISINPLNSLLDEMHSGEKDAVLKWLLTDKPEAQMFFEQRGRYVVIEKILGIDKNSSPEEIRRLLILNTKFWNRISHLRNNNVLKSLHRNFFISEVCDGFQNSHEKKYCALRDVYCYVGSNQVRDRLSELSYFSDYLDEVFNSLSSLPSSMESVFTEESYLPQAYSVATDDDRNNWFGYFCQEHLCGRNDSCDVRCLEMFEGNVTAQLSCQNHLVDDISGFERVYRAFTETASVDLNSITASDLNAYKSLNGGFQHLEKKAFHLSQEERRKLLAWVLKNENILAVFESSGGNYPLLESLMGLNLDVRDVLSRNRHRRSFSVSIDGTDNFFDLAMQNSNVRALRWAHDKVFLQSVCAQTDGGLLDEEIEQKYCTLEVVYCKALDENRGQELFNDYTFFSDFLDDILGYSGGISIPNENFNQTYHSLNRLSGLNVATSDWRLDLCREKNCMDQAGTPQCRSFCLNMFSGDDAKVMSCERESPSKVENLKNFFDQMQDTSGVAFEFGDDEFLELFQLFGMISFDRLKTLISGSNKAGDILERMGRDLRLSKYMADMDTDRSSLKTLLQVGADPTVDDVSTNQNLFDFIDRILSLEGEGKEQVLRGYVDGFFDEVCQRHSNSHELCKVQGLYCSFKEEGLDGSRLFGQTYFADMLNAILNQKNSLPENLVIDGDPIYKTSFLFAHSSDSPEAETWDDLFCNEVNCGEVDSCASQCDQMYGSNQIQVQACYLERPDRIEDIHSLVDFLESGTSIINLPSNASDPTFQENQALLDGLAQVNRTLGDEDLSNSYVTDIAWIEGLSSSNRRRLRQAMAASATLTLSFKERDNANYDVFKALFGVASSSREVTITLIQLDLVSIIRNQNEEFLEWIHDFAVNSLCGSLYQIHIREYCALKSFYCEIPSLSVYDPSQFNYFLDFLSSLQNLRGLLDWSYSIHNRLYSTRFDEEWTDWAGGSFCRERNTCRRAVVFSLDTESCDVSCDHIYGGDASAEAGCRDQTLSEIERLKETYDTFFNPAGILTEDGVRNLFQISKIPGEAIGEAIGRASSPSGIDSWVISTPWASRVLREFEDSPV